MDRNKPGYMNFDDIADRLESGKLNAYDVVYTKDTHEVVFIKEDLSLIRMKCRLDVYPSVVVAEYYLNLNTDTYVGQIVGIEQGEWICLYNVNYADNKFIVRKVGVDEYRQLANKPQINGVTLEGNKTTEQLGINIPTKFSQLYDDIGYVTFDHLIENYYSKSQTYSKSEVDTALAGKADTNDIPTDLADLQDDSTHRTVTDENIATWNGKSNVIANPAETTEVLNSIEIDGVGYAVAGSGGGAVHSVNGKTGDVVLNANDVSALPDDTPLFSGDYNDLDNKPDIPDDLADLHDDANHRTVTDAEKTQWNAAEANVQADWNQTTTSADDYIKNKPANLVQDANYVHTDNNFTNANKTKLNDIEAGAEVNVQSDWNQTDSTQDDYIKNKPSIPDPQIQSDWNQTSGTAKDFIKNKPTLGSASALDVAATGDASSTQVVKGDDSRLSDARTPVSHTHTLSEITDAGTAAAKDSTSSVTANSTDLVESGAVKTAIDNAISGAYKHAGTKTCAELISSLLIASNNGNVYNITDNGTTTSDFIEGAGITIRAGDNVGIAKISDGVYKFDLLSGFIDTSNFITKSSTSGLVKNDGSIDTTEYAPASSVPAAQIQSDWSQSDNTKLDYIKNKPTLGTASAKNVPASGNAGTSEVVMGNDTRLTDARNAADVYSWAKAENKPSYTKSEVGLGNVDNTSDATKKTNFTGSIASENTGFVTGGDVYAALGNKVDKVDGKGLSSNDYTTNEKTKLSGISDNANKVESSQTNGNIKIDNTETQVYDDSEIRNIVDITETTSTKGSFVSLTTKSAQNAKSAIIDLQSIQDLHGYDKPWVGGAGKNLQPLLLDNIKSINTDGTWNENVYTLNNVTITVQVDSDNNITGIKVNGTASANIYFWYHKNMELPTGNYIINGGSTNISAVLRQYNSSGSALNTYSTTTSLSFTLTRVDGDFLNGYFFMGSGVAVTNVMLYPMIRLSTVTDSTFEPYTNIASILGRTSVDIDGCGKNMLGCMEVLSDTTATAEFNGDEIKVVSASNGSYKASNFVWDILPSQWGKRIYISCASATSSGSNDWRINLRISLDGINYTEKINIINTLETKTMLIPENTVKMMLLLYSTSAVSGSAGDYVIYKKLQLEYNEDGVTEYELPQQSNNLTINLGRTVYGGSLDLSSGLLTVDKAINVYDGSNDENWIYGSGSGYVQFTMQISDCLNAKEENSCSNLLPFKDVSYRGTENLIVSYSDKDFRCALLESLGIPDVATWRTYLSSNNLQICYKLATPITYQLTPHELYLLKGANTITVTDSEITITYVNGQVATLSPVSDSEDGLMSFLDKQKLDSMIADATKVEDSETNGNIKIDNVETQVYDDTAVTTAIDNIEDELSTDYATVEGNPINFTTLSAQKSKSTILSLEPIQDLHGYDYPWVGGAGKNLLKTILTQTTSSSITWIPNDDGTVTTSGTRGSGAGAVVFGRARVKASDGNITISGLRETVYYYVHAKIYDSNNIELYSIPVDRNNNITADISSYTDAYEIEIAVKVANSGVQANGTFGIQVEIGQTATTWTPYENICPISGRSSVELDVQSANLYEGLIYNKSRDSYGNLNDSTNRCITDYFDLQTDKTYTIKVETSASGEVIDLAYQEWASKATGGNSRTYDSSWVSSPYTVTLTKNTIASLAIRYSDNSDINANDITVQVRESNPITISLGQTVYGGTLDVENGVLVVDRVLNEFDGSEDEDWHIVSGTSKFYIESFPNLDLSKDIITNKYPFSGVATSGSASVLIDKSCYIQNVTRVWVYDSDYADISALKAELVINKLQVCYFLTNPITIQLTPNEISLLEGVNNISILDDNASVKLTYRNGKFATLDGAVPKMTFRGEDYTMGVDDIGLFLKNLTKSTKTYITNPLLNFDGTVATYKKIMKQWFINNGVNIMDSTGITYLCERWYEITKQGWKGGTSFPAVGVSTGSTGTRFDDNADMSVIPSTDTSANTDTYQGLPLFAITDCNWELDSDGNILITAIDGITDNFVRDDPTKFVGVMQQTGWVKKVDDASTQKYYYADDKDAYEDLVPLPEAIKLDGTVRSFVVHAKYMSGIVDSKMTCCAGVIPRRNISHDSLVTLPDNIGTQYSGGTSVDWSFLVWMQRIKYASLTSDGVLQGCCNYNYQYYVKVGEADVKRLILAANQGGNLKVGSTITFGAYAGNADRGNSGTYSISGQDGAIITSIEDVTIDGTTYKAVYVNTENTFTTVANGDATNGTTIVSTYHWISGSCDNVKGNDGSPVSATNSVYPAKLQGIEYMVGGYEVFADVIMDISGGYYNPYYARKSTDQATSITSSMVQSTLKCAQPASDAWRYIQKHGFDGEIFYPILTGTSSSEYTKDAFYENGTGTTTGTREWLAFGGLHHGSGLAGLSCLHGNGGLGNGWWYFVARLSCNGNRGILLTA